MATKKKNSTGRATAKTARRTASSRGRAATEASKGTRSTKKATSGEAPTKGRKAAAARSEAHAAARDAVEKPAAGKSAVGKKSPAKKPAADEAAIATPPTNAAPNDATTAGKGATSMKGGKTAKAAPPKKPTKTPLQYPGAAAIASTLPKSKQKAKAAKGSDKKSSRAREAAQRKKADSGVAAPVRVRIGVGPVSLSCYLNASETARALAHSLPLEGTAKHRGEEVFFPVAPELPPENPRDSVSPGIVGYAPEDHTICLFHGVRPMHPVNVVGILMGDPQVLLQALEGDFARMDIPLHEDDDLD